MIYKSRTASSVAKVCIARIARRELNLSLEIAESHTPLLVDQLTGEETGQFTELQGESRIGSWLLGRSALKKVMEMSGLDTNTSAIRFPNRHFSLSHSGTQAIAMYVENNDQTGVGIDIEQVREINPGTAKYFLTDEERSWIDQLPRDSQQRHLRRLWTVKEAVFKADPNNADSIVSDYAVNDCAQAAGFAVALADPCEELIFYYCTIETDFDTISIAVSQRG